jgi:hypothetical protein
MIHALLAGERSDKLYEVVMEGEKKFPEENA